MITKKKCLSLCLVLSCFAAPSLINAAINYPNCKNNPYLTEHMQTKIAPYLLPLDHPMKPKLDAIFSKSRATETEKTLVDAGFEIIVAPKQFSFVVVARHPEVPGYVFKLHLDTDKRARNHIAHWKWLVRRCEGAREIGKIIKRKNIRHFTVPDKWLYVLPVHPFSRDRNPEPIILLETYIPLETKKVTRRMWRTGINHEHLDELYSIIKHGYGGHGIERLVSNLPYATEGKFAFIDTEDFQNNPNLAILRKFFSEDMQLYWDRLIKPKK